MQYTWIDFARAIDNDNEFVATWEDNVPKSYLSILWEALLPTRLRIEGHVLKKWNKYELMAT